MAGKNCIEEVLLTISIDTECDHDPAWRRSDPLAFESITEGLPNRLQPAFTDVKAIPTYLLTVEVLEYDNCIDALRQLPGQYEYGTHLHSAFIEPEKKFQSYAGVDSPDFQCNCPPEIEYQKLKNLTHLFSEPLMRWSEPNGSVDFRQAPAQPYYPSRDCIARAGEASTEWLLEVPVTVKKKLIRRSPAWFRPWFSSVDQMKSIFHHHTSKYADKKLVTINMMFHSMEVIEKASPYPQNQRDVERFIADMHEVLYWCKQEGVTFCGLSDCHEKYKNLALN